MLRTLMLLFYTRRSLPYRADETIRSTFYTRHRWQGRTTFSRRKVGVWFVFDAT